MSENTNKKNFNKRIAVVYSATDNAKVLNPTNAVREVFNPAGAVFGTKKENEFKELKELVKADEKPVGSNFAKIVDTIPMTDLAFVKTGDKGFIAVVDKAVNEPVRAFEVKLTNDGKMTTTVKNEVDENFAILNGRVKFEELGNFVAEAAYKMNELRKYCDKDMFIAKVKELGIVEDGKINLDTVSNSLMFIEAVISSVTDKENFIKEFNEAFNTDVKNLKEAEKEFNFFYLTGLKFEDLYRGNYVLKLLEGKKEQEINEILKDYNDKDKFYFRELKRITEELGIKTNIKKANFIKVGYDANGNVFIYENKSVNSLENGTIHSDLGFAELTREAREAIATIEAYFNKKEDEDRPTIEEAQEAENVLREKATELLKTDNSKYAETIKDFLVEMDVAQLDKDDYNELNTFKAVFDYYIKKTKADFAKKMKKEIYSLKELLTKPDTEGEQRLRYNSNTFFEDYGIDADLSEEERDSLESVVIVSHLPQVSMFSNDFYCKTKAAIAANVYFAGDRIVEIKSGVSPVNYLKTYGKLGNTLLGVMNMQDAKNARNYAIELGNIMKFQEYKDGQAQPLNNVSKQYKDFINALSKGFLKEIQKKLNDGDIDGAKEFIAKAFENAKEKTPVYALKEFINEYKTHRNEIYSNNKISFAGKMKKVREAILEGKVFNDIKDSLNKNEKSIFGVFGNKLFLAKDALQAVKETDITKLHEKNPDLDEKSISWMNIESQAKNLAYVFRSNALSKLYYRKDENNTIKFMPNITYGRGVSGIVNPIEAKYEYGNRVETVRAADVKEVLENIKMFSGITNGLVEERGQSLRTQIEESRAANKNNNSKYFKDAKVEVNIEVGELKTSDVDVKNEEKVENDTTKAPDVTVDDIDIPEGMENAQEDDVPEPGECENYEDVTNVAIEESEKKKSVKLDSVDL